MKIIEPLIFATIASVGNAMFALGQKKAVGIENTLAFVVLALFVAIFLTLLFTQYIGVPNYNLIIQKHSTWIIISGIGLFLIYIGLNLLYVKGTVSSYILYAIISIITTSIITGAIILQEHLNIYHWSSIFVSIVAVILFSIGNKI